MLLSWKAAIQKTDGPGAAIVIYTVRVNEIKKFVVWKPTRGDGRNDGPGLGLLQLS
jgi:hypothetical protein